MGRRTIGVDRHDVTPAPWSIQASITAAYALLGQALYQLDLEKAQLQGRIDMLLELAEMARAQAQNQAAGADRAPGAGGGEAM